MSEKLVNVDYESEMSQSYVDYAMSVITERALPDVRDGLKPVQRRTLYSMVELNNGSDKPHRKCARIVGDCMGKYHPHGDSSIYECVVNLAQAWKSSMPLIDPHGNFGAVDGSGAAAMRYTEARLQAYTEDICTKDLSYYKDSFVPNFDGTEMEPTFLPMQVPNLLINGSTGIAVSMATNIPSHNLGEIIDATVAYMENNDITTEQLLDIVQGPDFPTRGIINTSKENLINIYETGIGKLKVRGKVEIRDIGRGRKSICVTELPFTMLGATEKFLNDVAALVRSRELDGVVEIADRGDKNGECLCIDVKKGMTDEEIQNICNILYKKTGLEDTYGVNINCINKGKPEVMGLKRVLKLYTEFKTDIYNTKYKKMLDSVLDNLEVKNGLLEAVDVIDLIIEILRGSHSTKEAKACLMHGDTTNIKFRYKGSEADAKLLHFTEKQTDAILGMRLQKLIGLEVEALIKEIAELEKLKKRYTKLLESPKAMTKQMIEDMLVIKEKYGYERRTVIENIGEVKIQKQEEAVVDVCVLLDRFYYIKVIDAAQFEKNKDLIEKNYRFYFKCTSVDRVGIFTDGKNAMHLLKVQDIIKLQTKRNATKSSAKAGAKKKDSGSGSGIMGKLTDKGIQIFEFTSMENTENIIYMDVIANIAESKLLFVNDKGYGKRVEGNVFDVTRKEIAFTKPEDKVVFIGVIADNDNVIIRTVDGYYTRFEAEDVSVTGKGAGGVRLINLNDGDLVEYVCVGSSKANFIVNDKEVAFTRVKMAKRGAKGSKLRITN